MAAWKHGYCVIDRVVTPSWLQSREPVVHETSMEVAAVGMPRRRLARSASAGGVDCGLMIRRATATIKLHDREDAEVLILLFPTGQSVFLINRCMRSVDCVR
ncbi:hypothetical protein VDGL01_02795 [Verticillium dahliae]